MEDAHLSGQREYEPSHCQAGTAASSSPVRAERTWSSMDDVAAVLGIEAPREYKALRPRFNHRILEPGAKLYRAGDAFTSLYLVRSGFVKIVSGDDTVEHVLGFSMKDDLLGSDGIGNSAYASEVVALGTVEVITLPYPLVLSLSYDWPGLKYALQRSIGQEMEKARNVASILATKGAAAKVAFFILAISDAHFAKGYSAATFTLRMSRADIGKHLGLVVESVSRALCKLVDEGVISITHGVISIHAREKLLCLLYRPFPRIRVTV